MSIRLQIFMKIKNLEHLCNKTNHPVIYPVTKCAPMATAIERIYLREAEESILCFSDRRISLCK